MSRNWAICIGINDYYNLQPLQYAVQDAASIRDFFKGQGEFEGQGQSFEKVYYFANNAPPIQTPRGQMRAEPTYANLKRFFRERFQPQREFLDVGDNFWFFFAGHGELHEGHDYLMPLDVDPGNLEETALRISDITAYLRNSGADNTVMLLDACRNRSQRGVGLGMIEQKGVVTIYSCSPRKPYYEIDTLGHGSFTYALLEGLALSGTQNCATVERLDQYLRYRVPALNDQHGKPTQIPFTVVEPLSKSHLILLPQKATLGDVLALKNDAQEAELENELELAEQLWIRVLAASPADRQAIDAVKRIALKQARRSTSPAPGNVETAGSRSVEAPTSPAVRLPTPPKLVASTLNFEVVTVNNQGKIIQRAQRSAEYHREDLGNGITLDSMLIPKGTFVMGAPSGEEGRSSDEGPHHQVTVPQFWIGKYPITQSQYRAVMGNNPSCFSENGANRPVEQVNWDDAVAFCQKLSKRTGRDYRLPSEAEWEYACRAGTTTPFYFGPTITPDLVNYNGNYTYGSGPEGEYREQTTEVGSYRANAFGLYDMHGNVWEWCLDHWHDSYEGAPNDGKPWVSSNNNAYRLLRGGSWFNYPSNCRSANRGGVERDNGYNDLGFRVISVSS